MALISVRNRFESFMEQRYPDLSLQVKGNIGASMKAQLGIRHQGKIKNSCGIPKSRLA
ncbi:hypothetical protein AAIM12_000797 [Escherichia coli]|uniref:hypothetical protein n=1 Tax=Escherichia coli TaxID=562 RepID=UPI00156C2ADF|nr:hypothetical protein [Escherichia coli]EER3967531.1 hypothetical protein [Escherichia coli]EET9032791.1 hypothetical protein [Escherichia coli]EEZ9373854.1 hypothetical protein [Escherichia coli]EFD9646355.1 hypothetical protein [Escherichia coli]EFH5155162.1 hypothetical protein [Escherichia coli]